MNATPVKSTPTELEQAAADRRSFGNAQLAANAEYKVIAEALRELVTELRLIRLQLDKVVSVVAPGASIPAGPADRAAGAPAADA
jgi:hypothetical protein